MAVKLNLLPSDYTVTGPAASILKVVRPLNVILLAVFLVATLGMAGFLIISSVTLNNLTTANENIRNQIQSQKAAQQQIVLLKDRLGKIVRVLATPDASNNIANISLLINSMGENTNLTEIEADSRVIDIMVEFKSNSDFANFVEKISSLGGFSSITMDTFGYSPITGYSVGFSLVGKSKI